MKNYFNEIVVDLRLKLGYAVVIGGNMTYTLIMINNQGVSEETCDLPSKAAVRRKIREWHAKVMKARVYKVVSYATADTKSYEGECIYNGPALSFR